MGTAAMRTVDPKIHATRRRERVAVHLNAGINSATRARTLENQGDHWEFLQLLHGQLRGGMVNDGLMGISINSIAPTDRRNFSASFLLCRMC
jgi:hypothetical protein